MSTCIFSHEPFHLLQMFAYAAREHTARYGTTTMQYAKIAHKNRKHGVHNPNACFRKELPLEAIPKRSLCEPITSAMSAMTADGAAAAIVASEAFVRRRRLEGNAVEIVAQHMLTDLPSSFGSDFMNLCGVDMATVAAQRCFADSGLSIDDVDVIEVHDCFSCNEVNENGIRLIDLI